MADDEDIADLEEKDDFSDVVSENESIDLEDDDEDQMN